MKYTIVNGANVPYLIEVVNRHAAEGWEPIGSPVFQAGSYSQAMVKR